MSSIAYYNSLITKYNKKIEEFKSIKTTINGLGDSLSACEASINNFSTFLEYLIINNEPIDQGAMEQAKGTLQGISGDLDTISGECDTKIEYYKGLRADAVEKRNELRRALSSLPDSVGGDNIDNTTNLLM